MNAPIESRVSLEAPRPDDAAEWLRFLVAQQLATYGAKLPAAFGDAARDAEELAYLADVFANPGTDRYALARAGGRIVGIASSVDAPNPWEVAAGYTPAPAARELERLYLDAEWHGRGLGGALFDQVVGDEPIYLWLIEGNDPAARFYERRGFRHLDESVPTGGHWGRIPMHRMLRD